MHLWIKASTITFAIAMVILFFLSFWFLNGRRLDDIKNRTINTNSSSGKIENVKLLKDSLFVSTIPENYSNFALRLSSTYVKLGNYDSAARYKELVATRFPNEENWKNAGLMYFKAFKNTSGEEEEQYMAFKAIACLEKGFSSDSSEKVKLALSNLYLAYEKPNEAIHILQEVLSINATNNEALYLMGIHMFQLDKYESANNYLYQLVEVDSSNINGLYFLAISHVKLGNPKKAKVLFEKLKLLDISEEVKAEADNYLSEIK